jgi:hypothetical protein
MKMMTRVLTVSAALAVVLSLALPVGASCTTATLIGTAGSATEKSWVMSAAFQNDPSFYYYYGATPVVYSLTAPDVLGADAKITYWKTGSGDPALGLGDDSGTYDMIAGGGFYQPYAYPSIGFFSAGQIFGSWFPPGIDGCIGPNACSCILLTSQDGVNGFWALTGGLSTPNGDTFINQGGTDASGNNEMPIVLVPMDAPQITGSVRRPNFDVELSVSVPAPSAGLYVQDGCACGPTGFKVLQQVQPRGAMPPSERNAAAWTELSDLGGGAQAVTPMGGTANVVSACGSSDVDVWLTTQLFFDSGFSTSVVSKNATRVECGPNLANPNDRPKPLNRPGTRSDRVKPRGSR